jgi:hypothetical protein
VHPTAIQEFIVAQQLTDNQPMSQAKATLQHPTQQVHQPLSIWTTGWGTTPIPSTRSTTLMTAATPPTMSSCSRPAQVITQLQQTTTVSLAPAPSDNKVKWVVIGPDVVWLGANGAGASASAESELDAVAPAPFHLENWLEDNADSSSDEIENAEDGNSAVNDEQLQWAGTGQ